MSDLLASAETVYRAIIEDAIDFAIFLITEDGSIETWNAGAQSIFGYAPAEIIGHPFRELFTELDRRNGVPERELTLARTVGRADDTRWHLRKDGSRFFADGVTTPVRDDGGAIIGFSKIQRDITERHRSGQRLATQLALTQILTDESPFTESAVRIMETICTNLGWDLGILWRVGSAGESRCVELWNVPEIDHAIARTLCPAEPLPAGVGLPGLVVHDREPHWIVDFASHSDYPRAPLAAKAKIRSAVAFPITHDGIVTGVMEFFSREEREPDQALLPLMSLVGAQIGDFLERRRTLAALRTSEERYRVVSETAQDAIFTIDEQSRILFCNRAVKRIFGFEPEALVGQPLSVIIPERHRSAHDQGVRRYLETGQRRLNWEGVQLPGLTHDGREIPLEISFGTWSDGERTIFTGFARDITERQRALEHEQQLREEAEAARGQLERRAEEESSFRHLASALTGAVEMSDVMNEITNRATLVTRADGVYVERIVGKDVEVVASAGRGVPPRGLRVAFPGSMTQEILKNRQPVILADMRSFGSSMAPYLTDTCADCEVLVTPLIAEEEALGSLVLLNSRQSGRHFRESDTVRARTLGDLTSLALRRVRLMEQEREAKEKAEAAVRVRDETLGIVSHDLRNPLTKISLSAELLAEADDGERGELIETIRLSSRQAQRLIQDLLDVARVEAGRFSVNRTEIDSAWIVARVCESHDAIARQKNQRIVCELAPSLPQICGDRDRLLQVFGNLIGNAMKFTPEEGTISISAKPDGHHVLFRVTDSGPGIPEADLKNVFRPYWQAKKTAHMGAGLGLAIVRGIVEAHGGTVWAGNAPGGGAEFAFTIPTA